MVLRSVDSPAKPDRWNRRYAKKRRVKPFYGFISLWKLGLQGAGDPRRGIVPVRVRLEHWLHR